jgi:cyclin-dependent kinase 8/11
MHPDRPLSDFYIRGPRIGGGTYGTVYQGTLKSDPAKLVTIKEPKRLDRTDDRRLPVAIFRELTILSEIDYPHIVRVPQTNIFRDRTTGGISFVYEYGAFDVRKMIHLQKSFIKPVIAKSILFQLLLALDHLHRRKIAHCDVTPSNLLIMPLNSSVPGVLKLIDFGLSRVIDDESPDRHYGVVTVWYRAPELLVGDRGYTEKIDVWAAGCIFAELLTGSVLFRPPGKDMDTDAQKFNKEQITAIFEIIPLEARNFNAHRCDHLPAFETFLRQSRVRQIPLRHKLLDKSPRITESAIDLAEKMLKPNPVERISSAAALLHPYFNEIPLSVMNIATEFASDEWDDLGRIGKNPTTEP